jgi:hypothetical protein
MTLLSKLNRIPPFLCRLVARKRRGYLAMTRRDIAAESGLNIKKVDRLSKLARWDNVKLSDIQKFSAACGVNLLASRRVKEYMKRERKIGRMAWRGRGRIVSRFLKVSK